MIDADDEQETDDRARNRFAIEPDAGIIPIVSLKPTVLKMSDSLAADVISRHAGSGEDQSGFLPCLRRGEPVPAAKAAELIYALNQLEEELKGCRHDRPPDGPSLAQARTRVPGVADRRVAGRLRRARDHGHPDRAGGRRADPLRPGHPLLSRSPEPQLRSDDVDRSSNLARLSGGRALSATAAMPWRPFGPRASKTSVRRCASRWRSGTRSTRKGAGPRSTTAAFRAGPAWPSTRRAISRLIDYPFADMTITVEAGMTLSALRAILAEQHQRVLVDAPDPERATLGGIYATNTSGPRRFAAGRPRDQIIGVSFVTSEGVVVKGGGRVVKNVAGYDFPKLLTGSMGTLGIITQLTLKVRPIPEASALVWVPFWNPKSLADTLDQLNTSGTRPVALEFLNGSVPEPSGRDWACRPVRASSSSATKTMRARSAGRSTG